MLPFFFQFVLHSSSGEYLLTGTSNGCIRIHQLEEPHSLANLTSHWSLTMHDNHYGAVTHLVTSFDDKYVLSGGADGNLFVFEGDFPTAEERAQAVLEAKVSRHMKLYFLGKCPCTTFQGITCSSFYVCNLHTKVIWAEILRYV